jgi:D-lactate dehydrogenase (cytochrome)
MIIKKDKSEIENYLSDAANYSGYCDAVYFPESESDVIDILKNAHSNKTHVTVSGNGTGLTGGRVPEGGLVISTEKLNSIIQLNLEEKFALVEPGVLLADFQEECNSKGLLYPPDPTEQNCFIGGTIATNSSGAKTFKYGPTRNFVEELRIVLADGEVLDLKRGDNIADGYTAKVKTVSGREIVLNIPNYAMPDTKHSAGYYCKKNMDVIDLFIGSEGTLGVVTKAKLRLVDLAGGFLSSVIFFQDESDALKFVNAARDQSLKSKQAEDKQSINALALEFFDTGSLKYMQEDYPNIPSEAAAAIWFEQEAEKEFEDKLIENWMSLAESCNADLDNSWFAVNESERRAFKDFRHAISYKITEYISRQGIRKVGTDTAVPNSNFAEYYEYSKNLVRKENIKYIAYGHIGDSHLHMNMLPRDENEYMRAKDIYKKLCSKAVELNGTISAEHGIGKLKREHLYNMYGEDKIRKMAGLKRALDPDLILSPGNIFDSKYLKEK